MFDDDEDYDDDETQHSARSFLAGIALGMLVGAGVALLFAPDRGDRLRRRIGRRFRQARDDAGESFDEFRESARDEFERRKKRIKARLAGE